MSITTLSNGISIPKLGFGVYQIPAEGTAEAVSAAIAAGYRHIDTAQAYFNEKGVSESLRAAGVDRSELFITTKVWIDNYGRGKARKSIEDSLTALNLDTIDLVLLHQPFGDVYGSWRDLQDLYREGVLRSIGVSNFTPARLHDLGTFCDIYPMVNQIEINPFHQQAQRVADLQEHGVAVEAWAPFGEGRQNMFTDPTLSDIAETHDASVAQVILAWLLSRGIIPLAKSVHPERMRENIAAASLVLSAEDIARIDTLDRKESLFFDHETIETVDIMAQLVRDRRH